MFICCRGVSHTPIVGSYAIRPYVIHHTSHRFNTSGEACAEAGEEAFDVGHDEFGAADELLAFLLGDGLVDDLGGLFGGDAAGLARVHLAVLAAVFLQRVDGDVGLHAAGGEDGDADAVFVVLRRHGLEEAVEGVLGRRVGAPQREPEESGDAGGHGKLSAALRDHLGQHGLGEDDRGVEVDVHHLADDGHVGLHSSAALTNASVVVEKVDVPVGVPGVLRELGKRIRLREVEGEIRHVLGTAFQTLFAHLFQQVGFQCRENQSRARFRKTECGLLADTGRGAGNPDDFVMILVFHYSILKLSNPTANR